MRPKADRKPALRSAVVEFTAHGYEGASIDRIIDSSHMSRATFYKHFDSKLGAYLNAVAWVLVDYASSLPEPQATAGSIWDEFLEEIRVGHRFAARDPSLVAFLHEGLRIARAHPDDPIADAIVVGVRGRVGAWIERGQAIGEVRSDLPTDILIDLVTTLVETLDDHFILEGFVGDAHGDLGQLYVDMVRRAIGQRPPRA